MLLLLVGPFLLAACAGDAYAPSRISSVHVAAEADIAGCRYLDQVHGASSSYGVFAARGVRNARRDAMKQAQTLGATHIVWLNISTPYGGTSAGAKAYRCGS